MVLCKKGDDITPFDGTPFAIFEEKSFQLPYLIKCSVTTIGNIFLIEKN
jgi:hypothetical protein